MTLAFAVDLGGTVLAFGPDLAGTALAFAPDMSGTVLAFTTDFDSFAFETASTGQSMGLLLALTYA